MKSLFFAVVLLLLIAFSSAAISREIKEKVAKLDPKIKQTVFGYQSKGVPKSEIANKIKYSVGADAETIIDGINAEDKRNRSPAAKQAKQRQAQRTMEMNRKKR